MASSILAKLEACYGAERVVDVFANTGIALKARDLNIGCYVVRGVLTSCTTCSLASSFDNIFESHCGHCGKPRCRFEGLQARTSGVPHDPVRSWEM